MQRDKYDIRKTVQAKDGCKAETYAGDTRQVVYATLR